MGKRLRQALDRRGYEDIAWYSTPGGEGFVLFTHIEQIHTDGTPFSGSRRFLPEVTREYRGLSDFLQALFMAPPGRFRVIALVVTAEELQFSDETLSRSEATTLLRGPRRLASSVAQRPLTSDHQVYALIYEFTKRRSEPEGQFVRDSELTGFQHLQAAGLLRAMREAGP
ncbi:hypothetical protein NR798_25235 [Archangium gephyra]|uniref:hypothetical protein n=1 Tax=Archangium gephyra TaxID=48 RepID=UPI0035D4096C